MYKVLKRTCWAIVLPIRSFVFPCPRCRRRRGLLKVPNKFLPRRRSALSFPLDSLKPEIQPHLSLSSLSFCSASTGFGGGFLAADLFVRFLPLDPPSSSKNPASNSSSGINSSMLVEECVKPFWGRAAEVISKNLGWEWNNRGERLLGVDWRRKYNRLPSLSGSWLVADGIFCDAFSLRELPLEEVPPLGVFPARTLQRRKKIDYLSRTLRLRVAKPKPNQTNHSSTS